MKLHFSDETVHLPPSLLRGDGPIGSTFVQRQIFTYRAAADVIWSLPYARNSDGPGKYKRVLIEERGTCSSKHALLAALAREEGLAVQLFLGFYELNGINAPGSAKTLRHYGLDAVPESHCWLQHDNHFIDVSWPADAIQQRDLATKRRNYFWQQVIQPEDVDAKRDELHRLVIKEWAAKKGLAFSVEQILAILVECKLAHRSTWN